MVSPQHLRQEYLPELIEAVKETGNEAAIETLDTLVDGRRLRDIADLPFALAI